MEGIAKKKRDHGITERWCHLQHLPEPGGHKESGPQSEIQFKRRSRTCGYVRTRLFADIVGTLCVERWTIKVFVRQRYEPGTIRGSFLWPWMLKVSRFKFELRNKGTSAAWERSGTGRKRCQSNAGNIYLPLYHPSPHWQHPSSISNIFLTVNILYYISHAIRGATSVPTRSLEVYV